jgi:hypothetical protein
MARSARQTERSGGQKGRGLGGGIFARPRFPPPLNFVPTKLANRLFIVNQKAILHKRQQKLKKYLLSPKQLVSASNSN